METLYEKFCSQSKLSEEVKMFPGKNINALLTRSVSIIIVSLALNGCSGMKNFTFQEKLPTIAHVHIGHAVTGWTHAPDKKGLFVTAEEEGRIALSEAEKALEHPDDIENIKKHTRGVLHALDPSVIKKGPGLDFGLMAAVEESAGHITYAAKSDDSSVNVQEFSVQFENDIEPLLERSELILALGQEILELQSAENAYILASEIHCSLETVVNGALAAGDCGPLAEPDAIGLLQLREQIDDMIAREDPPYETVASRYLFGLIRLPSGKWAFSWLVNPFYSDRDGMNGGGNGGGY